MTTTDAATGWTRSPASTSRASMGDMGAGPGGSELGEIAGSRLGRWKWHNRTTSYPRVASSPGRSRRSNAESSAGRGCIPPDAPGGFASVET